MGQVVKEGYVLDKYPMIESQYDVCYCLEESRATELERSSSLSKEKTSIQQPITRSRFRAESRPTCHPIKPESQALPRTLVQDSVDGSSATSRIPSLYSSSNSASGGSITPTMSLTLTIHPSSV